LQEGLKYSLILVSAPAGFGKTTLISEWARQKQPEVRTAWVSLDEGDNDPVRFWDYFIAALKTLRPDFGNKILQWLHSSQPPSHEPLLNLLINEISSMPVDFVAVLDDYHLIDTQQIHNGITYLLEHMPARMHLVIASRTDPPLPLARFRGKGTMLAIGTDDFRFSLEDAASLMKELKTPELSTQDIAALNERTEGWAVGLKMAALSLSGQKDIPGFIASFTGSHRYVMDYLMEEVLHKQTAEIRDFLLKTSVLERLTGPLCDVLTGRQDGTDTLPELERGHLFIMPLDDSRQWYRYEHLFADLLRHQLESTCKPADINELRRRASQWYENNKLYDESIYHILKAQDWEKAAALITEQGNKKSQAGEFMTLYKWMQQLPEEVKLSQASLSKLYFLATSWAGILDKAESILKTLEKQARENKYIAGIVADLKAGIAWRRLDLPLVEKLAKKALLLLSPNELESRSLMIFLLGWTYYNRGYYKKAELLTTESYEGFQSVGNEFFTYSALGSLMSINIQKGRLRKAVEMARQALDIVGSSPASAMPHLILSQVYYEWNDIAMSIKHIEQMNDLSRLIGKMQVRVWIHDALAKYRLVQGDENGFLEALNKADMEANNSDEKSQSQMEHALYHILLAINQNDLVTAEKWNAKVLKYPGDLPFYLAYVPSRLLIFQGKKAEALEKLQDLYERAKKSGAQCIMIICRVYQALAAQTEEAALEFLTDALTMAEPEGYIRSFVDEGKLLKPLLEKALSKGVTPEYTRKLITIIEVEERQKLKRKKAAGAPSSLKLLLSERELEVIQLMAEGLSNQQIADRLIISLSTAKNHVHNIIGKLNVQGRTQAILQARELELL
jgi:LuxR family maltose regulon positive regulatory protein